jgi:DNA-binding NtrC family response regulator
MGFNVVVLESDPSLAKFLAGKLSSQFNAVHFTQSTQELHDRVAKNRPEVVVVDMEYSRLSDIQNLHSEFPLLPIVCTHRVPDERLWVEAMEAGATDVCRADEVESTLTSVLRSLPMTQTAVA